MKDGQTIGQWLNWDFETNGELEIRDKNRKRIYIEDSDGDWEKYEYDSKGNQIYFESSNGFWRKWEYDSKGKQIYLENSRGVIIDNRPKSYEDKVVEMEGVKYKFVKA
jgi:hypothetical protein